MTWAKGSCPVQEVGRDVKKFVDRLRGAQRGSDVLDESRLWRAGLIDRSPPPAPGGDSCMIWVSGGYPIITYGTGVPHYHCILRFASPLSISYFLLLQYLVLVQLT